jgi:hypothetical protein
MSRDNLSLNAGAVMADASLNRRQTNWVFVARCCPDATGRWCG